LVALRYWPPPDPPAPAPAAVRPPAPPPITSIVFVADQSAGIVKVVVPVVRKITLVAIAIRRGHRYWPPLCVEPPVPPGK
jgi:hypothetical protein